MDKERSAPETRSPTRFNEASEKRGSLPETRSPTSFNEASTRFNGASTEKRDSVSETRTPSRISTTSADSRSPLPESRSPTSFYKDNQKMPLQSDKTPPKQWETMGNYSRSRFDGDVKPPSSSSFGVKDSPDTREQKRDIPSSPTRLERQQAVEEPLRKYETSSRVENKVESEMGRAFPLNDKLVISNTPESDFKRKTVEPEPMPPPSNEDNEVFWDADDSLPPPPPLHLLDPLETSQDSLPLPSPPREVLVEFPTSYNDYNSKGNPSQRESASISSDIIKREDVPVVESAVEISEEPKVELNGPGKVDTSDVSVEPLETTASTDLSFHDNSPAENKKGSQRAPPPAPLIITSTPTRDEPSETDTPLDNSTSPYSLGSSTSTPSGSRPNSMLSPKLEALDKEKVSGC